MSKKMKSQVKSMQPLSEDQLSQVVGGTGDYKDDYKKGFFKFPLLPIPKLTLYVPYLKVGYYGKSHH